MYMIATLSGLFVISGALLASVQHTGILATLLKCAPLPAASFLIITGMYVLNDLVDANLDRSSKKNRPIPSGQVTRTQALFFVALTTVSGLLLVITTFSIVSTIIIVAIIAIGIMYSAPKISLKDRFVLKTVSISAASMLCLMLGNSFLYANNATNTNGNSMSYGLISIYAALMSGSIIFITSLLNDLGDVEGDKAFGRRTIPVMMGKKNTTILCTGIAAAMIVVSWLAWCALLSSSALTTAISVSLVFFIAAVNIAKVRKHLDDSQYIRKEHKKSISWHVMLQSALIVGSLGVFI
jgi:geranylgeranylglycerol-phosphate geranylgeranyltransferase